MPSIRIVLGLLGFVVAASCGAPAMPVSNRQHPPALDLEAYRQWRAIAPQAATWQQQQETIAESARKRLAIELLQEGNFGCQRAPRPHCAVTADMAQPEDGDGIDSPCFRRELARWAFQQLDERELVALGDAAIALATLPPPEHELNRAILDAFATAAPDQLLRVLTVAVQAGFPDGGEIAGALSPAEQRVALETLHVFDSNKVAELDMIRDRDVALAVFETPSVASTERLELIGKFTEDLSALPEDVRRALVRAASDPDCWFAAQVATMLFLAGDSRFSGRPLTRDIAQNVRALCLAAASEDIFVLNAYVPPVLGTLERYRVVDLANHTRKDTTTVVQHGGRWIVKDMVLALAHCTETHCAGGDHVVALRFVPAPDGGLFLAGIDRVEYEDACGSMLHEMERGPGLGQPGPPSSQP